MKGGSIIAFEIEPPFSVPEQTRFGVDPGTTHFGLAVVHSSSTHIYQVKMERSEKALTRMLSAQNVLTQCINYLGKNPIAIIEGAAFSSPYRQVELAEIRTACALWFYKFDIDVEIIPPATIRKKVFGSGKIKNPWSNISNDCAAALGCAFYIL